jgi:DNA polymerase III delta prime subunit
MNLSFFEEKPLLKDLDFPCELLEKYSKINIEELNNILICGSASSGKTMKIVAFLASLFDKKVYDLHNNHFEEDRKSMHYKSSIYHIEIDCIQMGSNNTFFIQHFIKTYSESRNIGLGIPKIIYFKNADYMPKQSQMILRKIIEKNSVTARFIFEVTFLSRFLPALISRCLIIKIKNPNMEEVKKAIQKKIQQKNLEMTDEEIITFIKKNNNIRSGMGMIGFDLKRIFGSLECKILTGKEFTYIYNDKMQELVNIILLKKQSFLIFQQIRDLIHEMYIHLVSMEELLLFIFNKVYEKYSNKNEIVYKLLALSVEADLSMKKGNKECIHIEHYIISIIDLIHN